MRIEIARADDRMAPSGKAILRSLQNESMPVIDLVIREAFQNSLDATIKGKTETQISVNTEQIITENIAGYFEKIDSRLINKFPGKHTVMSISDKNTYGLTGEINTADKTSLSKSNIYKLIYGLNMNQEEEGAGGSWGLGKTSFFRIGCGIVIYYSRIQTENDKYEERLAACLIENSDSADAIMPDNDRGIAWWGNKEPEKSDTEKSYPITDQTEIHEFLKDLKVAPYEGQETGTSIIIPFIEENKVVANDQDYSENNSYWWEKDLTSSVEMAIKRWYGPRIMNKDYSEKLKKSSLTPFINGKPISPLVFEDTFDWFYKLYSAGLTGESSDENITVKPLYLKRLGMENPSIPIGHISYTKLTLDELNIKEKNNSLTPLAYIGDKTHLESSVTSAKILAYSRKPGMIVQYAVDDANWMKGLTVEENTFILAYFVPNSSGLLHSTYRERYKTLESYLRDTENADHAVWIDKVIGAKAITIVERIKREVSKVLYENLSERDLTSSNSRTSALSRKFGSILLPKANFGKSSSVKQVNKPPKEIKHKHSTSTIQATNIKMLDENNIGLEFKATINQDSLVFFEVDTVDKKIDENKWFKYFEDTVKFPFSIKKIEVEKINGLSYDTQIDNKELDFVKLSDMKAGFKIELSQSETTVVEGKIELYVADLTMQPALSIKKLKE